MSIEKNPEREKMTIEGLKDLFGVPIKEENNESPKDELTEKAETEKALGPAILISLDMERNFKLYSYRIVSPEQFIKQISDLMSIYISSINKL